MSERELHLSIRNVRTCLSTLVKIKNLTIKSTNKFSIITICNWNIYQNTEFENDKQSDKQVTNKRQTSDNKQEHKECKEYKEYNTSSPKKTGDGYSPGFLMFWEAYPRKVGKGAAYKAWKKSAKENETRKAIMRAIPLQIKSGLLKTDDIQYCPYPATWLNQRRWEDEIPKIKEVDNGIPLI